MCLVNEVFRKYKGNYTGIRGTDSTRYIIDNRPLNARVVFSPTRGDAHLCRYTNYTSHIQMASSEFLGGGSLNVISSNSRTLLTKSISSALLVSTSITSLALM